MELSAGDTDDSIRGWFTSNKFDDMIGPMFYISESNSAAILPLINESISWDSLQEGIDYCVENHKACRNESGPALPPGFRVIDIKEQCISQVTTTTCDFFALSYVWGIDDYPLSKTTKANFETLTTPGALSKIKLPQTVQDAMTACAELGRRYLWVDRLCIIQDDLSDKASQISAMDRIYRSAQYVIVAYGSADMHSGMSGISRPRPQTQMRVTVWELTITSDAFDDFCDRDFKGCGYIERGWTYQEFELARRKLCFRNTQAFLECRHGRKEEYHRGFGDNGDENQTVRRVAPLFGQYTSHIEIYSRRRLTFYSDATAAITGVLHWLYEGKGDIYCGLPTYHFDRALLWYYESGELDRPPNVGFPSWSWASALGSCGKLVFFDATLRGHARFRSLEFCGTLAPWYKLNTDLTIQPLNIVPDDDICPRWMTYGAIAAEGGCVANVTNAQRIARPWAPRWPNYASYLKVVVPSTLLVSGSQLQRFKTASMSEPRKDTLVTFAQTTMFNWKISSHDTHAGIQLLSPDRDKVGEIALPLQDRSQYAQLTDRWGKTLEIMGISLAILTAPGNDAVVVPGRSVHVDGQGFPDIPVVNVLVIERRAEFVKRKHLGWGSDGEVPAFLHYPFKRLIAVKVPHPDSILASIFITKEAKALKVMGSYGKHKNINHMISYQSTYGATLWPAIFLDYAEFGSLCHYRRAWCKQEAQNKAPVDIPEPTVWKLFKDIILALDFVHNKCEFIHRDVKPDNILVTRSPTGYGSVVPKIPVFKLADFSRAVAYPSLEFGGRMYEWAGSLNYAPPLAEHRANVPARPSGDMGSFGATLQKFALGVLPVQSRKDFVEQMQNMQEPHPKLDDDGTIWMKYDCRLGAAYRPLNLQASMLAKFYDPNVKLAKAYQPFSDVLNKWYTKLWVIDPEWRATSVSLMKQLIPFIDCYIGVVGQPKTHRMDNHIRHEAAKTTGPAIGEAVIRADAVGQEAGKHIGGAAVEAWKHANSIGHEAAKTIGPGVGEAIKGADAFSQEKHPGEIAGIAACVVTTPVAIAVTGQVLGAAGFTAQCVAAGSAAAAHQSAIGNIAAGSASAVLQSAGAGGAGTAVVIGMVAGTVTAIAVAANVPGVIRAVTEDNKEIAQKADTDVKEE
ncbi:hypothetical protein E8E11_006864 [Didymella keratinophila]|nr:hypothetical protein E8E11_006864 [Didymella keratinophila]